MSDPAYRLEVTYAHGNTQEHKDLTPDQAEIGTGAFLSDLLHLRGEGITRLVVEIQK